MEIRAKHQIPAIKTLFNIGRIFYGLAVIETGLQAIYYSDFPYWLVPPIPTLPVITYISGILLVLAGGCIVFEKKTRPVSLLLGSVLLLNFCCYYLPYEFIAGPNYLSFGEWENAEKELAFASGAFIVSGCYPETNQNPLIRFLAKLIRHGTILFSITIICFGIDHFLFAKEAAPYVPSWIPAHLFWMYFCGVALIGAGLAIILRIKIRLVAILLGAMIFSWFIILHIPRVVVAPVSDLGGELTSAFIALAYSGIAFVIASTASINK